MCVSFFELESLDTANYETEFLITIIEALLQGKAITAVKIHAGV